MWLMEEEEDGLRWATESPVRLGEEACNSWLQLLTAKLPKITCHYDMDTHKKAIESRLQGWVIFYCS